MSKKYFEMDEYLEWKKQEQGQKQKQHCEIGKVALVMTGV